MELILILVAVAVIAFVAYKNFSPKLDTNKDGKVDVTEVKAAVKQAEVKVEAGVKKVATKAKATASKAKTAVKKTTTKARAK
jgi:Tfp pilus assembly protein PilE